jgi:hypothetical protein
METVPSFSHLVMERSFPTKNTTDTTVHRGPVKGQHVSVMYVPVTILLGSLGGRSEEGISKVSPYE